MKKEIKYELPIYSQALEKNPIIQIKGMDVNIELSGYDDDNRIRKISIQFNNVVCSKRTSVRFTPESLDSYDKIVQLVDSEWLNKLKHINQEEFNYWKPNHYSLYLWDEGLFQFIAQGYEVTEFE